LLSAGCEVIDLGVVPSPTVEFEIKKMNAAGGIIITASHNPPDWNALKFVGREGVGLTKEKGEEIEKLFDSGKFRRAKWDELNPLSNYKQAIQDHLTEILKHVDAEKIQKRKPSLILDCGNGTAGALAPRLFTELGCKVTTLNEQADGFFPGRNSEPTKENIAELIQAVKDSKADIGIAWDGDGDRVIFIDEKGGYVWGDKSFALCAAIKLRKNKGTVISTVATSNVVKKVTEENGGKLEYVKVGAPYIAEKMIELNSVLGGEEVGGVVWPEISWGKDGFMTAAKIVEEFSSTGKPLSQLIGELPAYFNAKTKVDSSNKSKTRILEGIREEFGKEGGKAITIDGVRLDFDDSWVIARPSGTENYFRVFSEAKTKGKAEEILAKYKKKVEEIIARV
jgi:phosphomannomutase/phosphoglucomutase